MAETLVRPGVVGVDRNVSAAQHMDRRTARSRRAMRDALAAEIQATGDLARVTVTGISERSGLTRRTFYSHFRDISDLVEQVEDEALAELDERIEAVAAATLEELVDLVAEMKPTPGSVELLNYIKANADFYQALLGEGGDPAFLEKIKAHAHDIIAPRALTGIDAAAAVAFFDYYLTFAISAETGVLARWLAGGMREDTEVMARIMTMLAFVRPGDLYGFPISFDVSAYSEVLSQMEGTGEDAHVSR